MPSGSHPYSDDEITKAPQKQTSKEPKETQKPKKMKKQKQKEQAKNNDERK